MSLYFFKVRFKIFQIFLKDLLKLHTWNRQNIINIVTYLFLWFVFIKLDFVEAWTPFYNMLIWPFVFFMQGLFVKFNFFSSNPKCFKFEN
jgi:hypothetical protein